MKWRFTRVLGREHPLRQALADDDDLLGVAAVGVGEVAARDDRHAERGEEARRHRAEARARILFAAGLGVALGGELEARPEDAGVAPRHGGADGDALDAGQLGDAPQRPRGRSRRSAPAVAAVRHDRHVDREHVAACRSRCGAACSASSVVSSMPAPASSTNDAAICVTAKTRSRRLVPEVIRTLPFDRPKPLDASGEGSRGTNASSTAAASARPTPTHSSVASTVRSSARTENREAYCASTATIGRAMSTPSTAPGAAEQQALGQQRPPQRAGARAERRANRQLALAPDRARQDQVRDVRAGDDEDQRRCRQQHQQHGPRRRGDLVAQPGTASMRKSASFG